MLGLVNYAKEPHSVELRDIPIPEIGEEDVLFKVQAVGICGSDLHQYTGKQSWKVNYPVVLGHEFAGSIAKLGRLVQGFKGRCCMDRVKVGAFPFPLWVTPRFSDGGWSPGGPRRACG